MKEYVLKYLKDNPVSDARELTKNCHEEFSKKIIEYTAWLPHTVPVSFRIYCVLEGITQVPVCRKEGCDAPVSIKTNKEKKGVYDVRIFSDYCSRNCMRTCPSIAEKRMNTMIDKYGSHNMRTESSLKKFKETCVDRYGVTNPNKTNAVREKIKKTNISRYGVSNFLLCDEGIEKTKETMMQKYGVEHHMKCDHIKTKCREGYIKTVSDRYGVDHTTKYEKKFSHIVEDDKLFTEFCSRYEHVEEVAEALEYHPSRIRARMAECGIAKKTKSSYPEKQIREAISQFYSGEIIQSDRTVLQGRELDLYLPEAKVAIEYNGMYWHSETRKGKYYHQKKTLDALAVGVRLIHIWEDDWEDENKRNIIISKIKSIVGKADSKIFARKCRVERIETPKEFYKNNHIQGSIMASLSYGLFYNDRLVAAMSFRNDGDGVYDLVRYASSDTVIGGFSKILSTFKKEVMWKYVYTFASLDYSNGGVYEKCMFEKEHITPPNYVYFSSTKNKTLSRYQTMKHKLKSILGDDFDQALTEKENMEKAGWYRVYDAGSIRYSIKNPLI